MTRSMVAASRSDEDDTLQEIHRKDGTKVLVASCARSPASSVSRRWLRDGSAPALVGRRS
jgi:hypothetical protein